mmetsp:Transcript_3459/g.7406  ORF Transcript_3459/g.7406 Transcript_3459/m.7406 type:complete len:229 (+) Transcript_3459:154-840(+)
MGTEDIKKGIQTDGTGLDGLVCEGHSDKNRELGDDGMVAEEKETSCITATNFPLCSKVLKVNIPRSNKRILYLIVFGSLVLVMLIGVKFGIDNLNGKNGESPTASKEQAYNIELIDDDYVLNLREDTTGGSKNSLGEDNGNATNLPDCEVGIDPIALSTHDLSNNNSTVTGNNNNQTNGENNEVIRRKMLRNSSSRNPYVAHSRKLKCNDHLITRVPGKSGKQEHLRN